MSFIAPFRGLRYNLEKVGRMEEVVSPPYDVIDEKGQAALMGKNPYNMIHLDLSKNFCTENPASERYFDAQKLFADWQAENILRRDQLPTIYVYNIEYTHPSGRHLTRKGLVALVRLAEFSEGIVKPHEKTFRGFTTDRLRLLDTCQAQFSQIFSIYSDKHNEVMGRLEEAGEAGPLASVKDGDGNVHTLRAVTDGAIIAQVREFFRDRPLYIADGHHRYTTALQMRELMRKRLGQVDDESPYNHTMMYLCPMEDHGLSVLPTHRLLRMPGQVAVDGLIKKLSVFFDIQEIREGTREVPVGEVLARMAESSTITRLGMYHPREDRCLLLALKKGAMEGLVTGTGDDLELPAALRELDVVVLSELVLARILGLDHERCEKDKLVEYFSDPDEALDVAVKEAAGPDQATPVLFLMNPTRVDQVKRVADEGLVMPHKSTYFYPKILTGLIINKLVPEERVE